MSLSGTQSGNGSGGNAAPSSSLSLDDPNMLPQLLPRFTPVRPNFRRHVASKQGQSVPAVTKCRSYLNDPEYLPAQCIRLGKHCAAPVLELPIDLSVQEIPSYREHPCLYYISSEVFVKHWNFAQFFNPHMPFFGEQDAYKTLHSQIVDEFVKTRPHNESLLTVAIVKTSYSSSASSHSHIPVTNFEFSSAQITFNGINVPLSICVLVVHGILSLHYVPERSALQFIFHQVPSINARIAKSASNFLSWLRNFKGENLITPVPTFDRDWVFDAVRRTRVDTDKASWAKYLNKVRSIDSLHVNLRGYQENAVAWMLSRELDSPTSLFGGEGIVWPDTTKLFQKCALKRETITIVCDFAFYGPTLDLWFGSEVQDCASSSRMGAGGLLCDEMGLGKTVELMQLVLCNQQPVREIAAIRAPSIRQCGECGGRRGTFFNQTCVECNSFYHRACSPGSLKSQKRLLCFKCLRRMAELSHESTPASALPESRATLVILPPALLLQWQEELTKHVKRALKVVTFLGLKRSGYIPQASLLQADVVLTTYDALRNDVTTVQALRNPRSNLRSKKQYFPTPVPLLLTRWHRVALDESQMLGTSSNTSCLKMARFLHAKYRWCVTGTPIADNLSGSLAMLSVLCTTDVTEIPWQKLCAPSVYIEDRKWVSSTLRAIMWRTKKIDVDDGELGLPPQIVEVVRTKFGPVERYHYRSLQREIMAFRASQQNRTTSFATYSREILTTLRQACCHPNVGTSGRRLLQSRVARSQAPRHRENADQAKSRAERPMEMKEVLASLISKSHAECQDSLRNSIVALNGLAGIKLLQASLPTKPETKVTSLMSAVKIYREGLTLAANMEHLVKMDVIQRMHILFNLSEALDLADSLTASLSSATDMPAPELAGVQQLRSLGRSLREGSLKEDFMNLRRSYLCDAELKLKVATDELRSKTSSLDSAPLIHGIEKQRETRHPGSNRASKPEQGSSSRVAPSKQKVWWWEKALAMILEGSKRKFAQEMCDMDDNGGDIEAEGWERFTDMESLVYDVRDALEANRRNTNRTLSRLANRLERYMNFVPVLESEIRALSNSREALLAKLQVLPGGRPPTEDEVAESGQCKECRESMGGPPCAHCLTEVLVQEVEEKLYSVSDNAIHYEDPHPLNAAYFTSDRMTRTASVRSSMAGTLRPSSRVRHRSGARMAGELEIVLKKISTIALKIDGSATFKQEISKWMGQLQKMKDEFASAKVVLEAQRSLLACMDEVKMAQTRLTLFNGSSFSDLSETERRFHVMRNEVGALSQQFEIDRGIALKDTADKRGRFSYLLSLKKNMEKSVTGKHGRDEFEEMCTICYIGFTEAGRIGVFKCAHMFCGDCTISMIDKERLRTSYYGLVQVPCPTCRCRNRVDEISFTTVGPGPCSKKRRTHVGNDKQNKGVPSDNRSERMASESEKSTKVECSKENPTSSSHSPDLEQVTPTQIQLSNQDLRREELPSTFIDKSRRVIGSHGCKTSVLIKLLSGIWKKEREAKVVAFSEWEEALDLIRNALHANHMKCYDGGNFARSSKTFSNVVEAFKHDSVGACLLLPLKKAAAGLNLIEATHVILVEPSMDIRLEKQAIGRVHRIGQTRVTYVHHLITEGTIEEFVLKRGDCWRHTGSSANPDPDSGLNSPEQLVNQAIRGESPELLSVFEIENNGSDVAPTGDTEVRGDNTDAPADDGITIEE